MEASGVLYGLPPCQTGLAVVRFPNEHFRSKEMDE